MFSSLVRLSEMRGAVPNSDKLKGMQAEHIFGIRDNNSGIQNNFLANSRCPKEPKRAEARSVVEAFQV